MRCLAAKATATTAMKDSKDNWNASIQGTTSQLPTWKKRGSQAVIMVRAFIDAVRWLLVSSSFTSTCNNFNKLKFGMCNRYQALTGQLWPSLVTISKSVNCLQSSCRGSKYHCHPLLPCLRGPQYTAIGNAGKPYEVDKRFLTEITRFSCLKWRISYESESFGGGFGHRW